MIGGFALGVTLVLVICPRISGTITKPVVAVTLLVLPAALIGVGGRQLGIRLSRALRRFRVHLLDEAVGALTAIASLLVVLWLFASVLVNSPLTSVSNEIEGSAVLPRRQQGDAADPRRVLRRRALPRHHRLPTGPRQHRPPVLGPGAARHGAGGQVGGGPRSAVRGEGRLLRMRRGARGLGVRRRWWARRHERARHRRDEWDQGLRRERPFVDRGADPFRPAVRHRRAAHLPATPGSGAAGGQQPVLRGARSPSSSAIPGADLSSLVPPG